MRRLAQRLRERPHLRDRGCGTGRGRRGFLGSIERVHHQDRIARFGETLAHLPEGGAQPEDVRPDENACCRAACRMHEIAVGRAVGRRHIDVRFRHSHGIGHLRQHHRYAGANEHAELPARHQSERLEFPSIVLEMILIAHVLLLLERLSLVRSVSPPTPPSGGLCSPSRQSFRHLQSTPRAGRRASPHPLLPACRCR